MGALPMGSLGVLPAILAVSIAGKPEAALPSRLADMADTLATPARWRRFRTRQAWLAVPFLLLALMGLLVAVTGVFAGLVLLLLLGPLGLLGVLNARSGRRGARSARLVTRGGAPLLEFPGHRLATVLFLLIVAVSLAITVFLSIFFVWQGVHGSIAAAAAGVFFVALTGYAVYGLWATRTSKAHRGWPAVRLGVEGVELASPLSGWFMPWDLYPVPMPQSDGVLRLVPLQALHELSQPLAKARLLRLQALPGSIPAGAIDADLTVVAAAVFFYGREPERRVELTSASGVQRVHRGDLPNPWPDGV